MIKYALILTREQLLNQNVVRYSKHFGDSDNLNEVEKDFNCIMEYDKRNRKAPFALLSLAKIEFKNGVKRILKLIKQIEVDENSILYRTKILERDIHILRYKLEIFNVERARIKKKYSNLQSNLKSGEIKEFLNKYAVRMYTIANPEVVDELIRGTKIKIEMQNTLSKLENESENRSQNDVKESQIDVSCLLENTFKWSLERLKSIESVSKKLFKSCSDRDDLTFLKPSYEVRNDAYTSRYGLPKGTANLFVASKYNIFKDRSFYGYRIEIANDSIESTMKSNVEIVTSLPRKIVLKKKNREELTPEFKCAVTKFSQQMTLYSLYEGIIKGINEALIRGATEINICYSNDKLLDVLGRYIPSNYKNMNTYETDFCQYLHEIKSVVKINFYSLRNPKLSSELANINKIISAKYK